MRLSIRRLASSTLPPVDDVFFTCKPFYVLPLTLLRPFPALLRCAGVLPRLGASCCVSSALVVARLAQAIWLVPKLSVVVVVVLVVFAALLLWRPPDGL